MEKELVKLVLEKEYDELTASERVSLREWCSGEEEFEHLKTVMRGVEQIRMSRQFAPRPEVKNSLDALFNQRQTKVQPVLWYNSIMVALYPKDKPLAQRPILQLAAVALLLLMVYPFMFNSDLVKKKEQLAQVEEQKEPLEKAPATKSTEKMEEIPAPIGNTRTVDVSEDLVDEVPMDMIVSANSAAESVVMDEPTAGMTFTWSTAPASVSTHPDGIYIGESAVSYSQSAATQPAVFDLLTTTF